MSTSTLGLFLRHLALNEEVSRLGTTSDHNLLTAYEADRGQAAFTELMRRHGPMVLRTCRRLLGQESDAEDAFQATFVLLAQKAGSISKREALGAWLHRVAYHAALQVLRGAVRRKAHERQASAVTPSDPDPVTKATWNEIWPILDAELDALPDEARRLLIACYLQEKTHSQAAAELGLPPGSVARHLERARGLLARRLARRGITVSALLLVILLEDSAKGAGVPAVLVVHTLEAARRFPEQAVGIMSSNVVRLVKGGLTEMAKGWTPWSMALVGWMGLLGVGLLACQTLKAWPDQTPEGGPPAAAERPAQEGDKSVRTDRYGDPLPSGALTRLGTVRWRNAGSGRASILFTRDGKGVISTEGGPAYLWEIPTGKPIRRFGDPARQAAAAVVLSPDGRILASGGDRFRLWDLATGKLRAEGKREGQADLVECLAFSSDGKRVASSGNDNKLRLWDTATGREQWVQNSSVPGVGPISALAFAPDGKTVAALDAQGISLWDAAKGEKERRRWNAARPLLQVAAFSADGRTLAVACGPLPPKNREYIVCLVDVATLKEVRQLAPEKEAYTANTFQSLAIAPGGKVLATANGLGEIRLWDMDTGKKLRHCQGGRHFATALAFSADGKMLAGLDGGLVRLWETASGKEVSSTGEGHRWLVSSVAFTSDGRTLISSGRDGFVRLWDTATGKQRQQIAPASSAFPEYELTGEGSAIAPDGKTLTVMDLAWPIHGGPFGAVVRQWDRDAGRERSRFFRKLGEQLGNSLHLSPDGKMVACLSTTGPEGVQLWEAATGRLLAQIAGSHPAFSPDGKLLATARDGPNQPVSVILWETATAKELCSFSLPEGHVDRLVFSPDGRALATLSDAVGGRIKDHALRLWPLLKDESRKSGSSLRVGPPRVLAEGLPYFAGDLAFSPDGRTLALPDKGCTVRVLETATGAERLRFAGHSGDVVALSFSPDGRRLASGSRDATVLVWDATGRLQDGRLRPAQLSDKELTKLWIDLAADDAGKAGRAIWTLTADPAQTVPFLAERMRPVPVRVTAEKIAKLIRDLDDDAFAVRVEARRELETFGAAAEPALHQALQKSPSLEMRRQLEDLLAAVAAQRKRPSGDVLRGLRAAEVLEQIGSRDARQVLKVLAAGAPESALTQEAGAALERLERAEKR